MKKKFERVWCHQCLKRVKVYSGLRLERTYGYNSVEGYYSAFVLRDVADCPSCGNAVYFL